jgi:hypothetical protein
MVEFHLFSEKELHNYYHSLADITEEEDEIAKADAAEKLVCKFYKDGKHIKCIGCRQKITKIIDCADNVVELLRAKPTKQWYEGWFESVNVESKKSAADILKLSCDTCYFADKCPVYKANSKCSLEFSPTDVESKPEVVYDFMISVQMERVGRARVMEVYDGGTPDQILSNELAALERLMTAKAALNRQSMSINISASGPAQQEGGLLAKIFGGAIGGQKAIEQNRAEPLPAIEEAQYEDVSTEEPKIKLKKLKKL